MGTAITHYIPYDLLLQNGAEATANGTEMELNGKFGTLVVQVMGITSATITFEAIRSGHKGDAYAAITGANRATGAFGSTATANGSYIFDVRGIKKFRARVSTYVSGTIYVHATATAQDAELPFGNDYTVVDAVIAQAGTASTEIDFQKYKYLSFLMPAAWTAATLTLKGSAVAGGTKRTIKNDSGVVFPVMTVAANEIYSIDSVALTLAGVHFLAFEASAAQADERTIKVMLKA